MKPKLLVISVLMLFSIKAFSQVPFNFLGRQPDTVSFYMNKLYTCGVEKSYTHSGNVMLRFTINDFKLSTKTNSTGNSIYTALFVFAIQGACSECHYLYANKKDIDNLVDTMTADENFIKKENVFGWSCKSYPFEVLIDNDYDKVGFIFKYVWLPSKKQ